MYSVLFYIYRGERAMKSFAGDPGFNIASVEYLLNCTPSSENDDGFKIRGETRSYQPAKDKKFISLADCEYATGQKQLEFYFPTELLKCLVSHANTHTVHYDYFLGHRLHSLCLGPGHERYYGPKSVFMPSIAKGHHRFQT